jgi:hypothetical protein
MAGISTTSTAQLLAVDEDFGVALLAEQRLVQVPAPEMHRMMPM